MSTLRADGGDRHAIAQTSKKSGETLNGILAYVDSCTRKGTKIDMLVFENVMGINMIDRKAAKRAAAAAKSEAEEAAPSSSAAQCAETQLDSPESESLTAGATDFPSETQAKLTSVLIDLGLTKGDQCSFLKRLLKQATGREARKGKTKPGPKGKAKSKVKAKAKAAGKAKAKAAKALDQAELNKTSLDVLREHLKKRCYSLHWHATKLSTDYKFLQSRSRIYMIAVNDALLNDAGPADV